MRVRIAVFILVFLLAGAVGAQPPGLTHVLVISLDGARPDALQMVDAPNIQGLAARGAVTWEAETILPSVTLPGHASMLTGLDVHEHGVDFNNTLEGCPALRTPTFLTIAEQAGYETGMVSGKQKFCLFDQGELRYTFATEGDRSVVDAAIAYLDEGVEVLFAHFPNPDYFGHSEGWMSEGYLEGLEFTDAQVGRLLDHLQTLGIAEETLVILTADHGGSGTSHGSDRPEDRLIPWIIAGPGIAPGQQIEVPVSVADTAMTVLWALGLPLPETTLGQPVIEPFEVSLSHSRSLMNATLKRATPDDAALLHQLIVTAFEPYRAVLQPPSGAHAETPQTIAAKLAKGGGLLACVGEDTAGGVLYELREGYVYMGRLAVLSAYRKQGIGRMLALAVEDVARETAIPAVQLGVRTQLPDNRSFFERLGYQVVRYETHPGFNEPTFMTLRKELIESL